MALSIWKKYNLASSNYVGDNGATTSILRSNTSSVGTFVSLAIDSNGYIYGSGNQEYIAASNLSSYVGRFVAYTTGTWGRITGISVSGSNTTIYFATQAVLTSYSQGTYIQDVTAEAGTYPTNGAQGGYWYVYQGVVNTAPSMPSSISVPTSAQKAGTTLSISWGSSSDAEGNSLTYYLEFFNGSSWVSCGSTANKSLTYTLPQLDINNAQFRVRAFDGALYSSYATSNAFSIFTNSVPTISGNANENLGDKNTPFSVTYSVNDVDSSNVLNVVEKLNSNQINSINNAPRNQNFTINIDRATLDSLPLNQQSVIQISVSDGKTTTYKTVTFTRINSGPTISNTEKDLGIVNNVSEKYTCTDVEGNAFIITEKINDKEIKTFSGVNGTEYTTNIPQNMWLQLINGQHTYAIIATDSLGAKTVRKFTFTKKETVIESTGLKNAIQTDVAATKIILTPNWLGKENADVLFQVCNNAFDANPTWEDATSQTLLGKTYVFTNKAKTADKWGIDIKYKLALKSGSIEGVDFYGLGGAFE